MARPRRGQRRATLAGKESCTKMAGPLGFLCMLGRGGDCFWPLCVCCLLMSVGLEEGRVLLKEKFLSQELESLDPCDQDGFFGVWSRAHGLWVYCRPVVSAVTALSGPGSPGPHLWRLRWLLSQVPPGAGEPRDPQSSLSVLRGACRLAAWVPFYF